jgi:hypothetical protein
MLIFKRGRNKIIYGLYTFIYKHELHMQKSHTYYVNKNVKTWRSSRELERKFAIINVMASNTVLKC